MSADPPLVTAIVPCRNEVRHIGDCLRSLLAGDYPAERLEVLVVDGMSEDGTREIVMRHAGAHPGVRLLDNPKGITPTALNLGLARARGAVILLVGAHAAYPANYISELVRWLQRSGADAVGGVCVTLPADDTAAGRAIAAALAHPFGVGNSYFRIGSAAPRWVDTVPFGCYRREVFERIGGFDEELIRNQDDELNLRLLRRGGRLLLVPHVTIRYFARRSLAQLWRMFLQYGYYKPLVARKVGAVLTWRQLAPAALVGTLLGLGLLAPWLPAARMAGLALIGGYLLTDLLAAAHAASRHGPRCAALAALAFPTMHFGYGIGYLLGLARVVRGPRAAERAGAVPLSR